MATNETPDHPTVETPDSINEFTVAGDFGFNRVDGPFQVEKAGTNWTVVIPDDHGASVRLLDDLVGEAAVLVADCEAIGGGILTDVYSPDGEPGRRAIIDQYALGDVDGQ